MAKKNWKLKFDPFTNEILWYDDGDDECRRLTGKCDKSGNAEVNVAKYIYRDNYEFNAVLTCIGYQRGRSSVIVVFRRLLKNLGIGIQKSLQQ